MLKKSLTLAFLLLASQALAGNNCDFDITPGQTRIDYHMKTNTNLNCIRTSHSRAMASATMIRNDANSVWAALTGGGVYGSFQTDHPYSETSPAADSANNSWNLIAGNRITITQNSSSDAAPIVVASGTGDVVGPASATDNAVVRFDSTTGKLIQDSGVLIDDSDNVSGIGNISLSGTVDGRDVATDGTKLDGITGTNTGDEVAASTAEVTTGTDNTKMVTPAALEGSTPSLGGVVITQTQTATSGTDNIAADSDVEAAPGATSTAVNIAVRGKMSRGDMYPVTGTGHYVGVLGQVDNDNSNGIQGTIIAVEGKVEQTQAGHTQTAVAVEAQLSANAAGADIDALYLVDAAVTGNEGNIDVLAFTAGQIYGNNSQIGTVYTTLLSDLDEDADGGATGDIETIFGYLITDQTMNQAALYGIYMADQTGTHAAKYFTLNACPSCPMYTKGDIQQAGASGGVVSVKAPDTASDYTVTWPAATGTPLLDSTLVVVTGKFTRAANATSGTQSITGLGGTPISIEIQMTNNDSAVESSFGFTDCTSDYSTINNSGAVLQYDDLIVFNHASGSTDMQTGRLDGSNGSCDSDGFTIDWLKAGSPPSIETLTMTYKALVIK